MTDSCTTAWEAASGGRHEWRDIRLNAYTDFIGAVREYVAHVLNPAARITAVPRPRDPGDLMPFFGDEGSRYRERLESTKTALRLVAGNVASACPPRSTLSINAPNKLRVRRPPG